MTIRTGDLEGILAAIPHLIRFQPCDSVVVVLVKRGLVAVSMRADLQRLQEDRDGLLATTSRAISQSRADTVLVIGYGPGDALDDDLAEQLTAFATAVEVSRLPHTPVAVMDVVEVSLAAGTYRSLEGGWEVCDHTALSAHPAAVPVHRHSTRLVHRT